jgi:hypothetical protein
MFLTFKNIFIVNKNIEFTDLELCIIDFSS